METIVSCICKNKKTFKSLDLSTNCPKRIAGNPCKYCYVECARKKGFNAKTVYNKIDYNGEILRMRRDTIDKLNSMGGLRVFSFGDYIHEIMFDDMMQIVTDAKLVGLKLKAITKVPMFVELFHNFFNIIHISVDNVGCGIDWNESKTLKSKYPNVLIRAAIMSHDDVQALEPWCDILTFNHADNGFKRFYPEERSKYAEIYPGKVCCQTNKCETCTVKCGQSKVS